MSVTTPTEGLRIFRDCIVLTHNSTYVDMCCVSFLKQFVSRMERQVLDHGRVQRNGLSAARRARWHMKIRILHGIWLCKGHL